MPGIHDVAVLLVKSLAKREVVLVDEELGRHEPSSRQCPLLFLVGHGCPHKLFGQVVAGRNLLDLLSGVVQLPETLRGDPVDRRAA